MRKEIGDYLRLVKAIENKKVDYSFERAKETAIRFSGQFDREYVVLKNGGNQVWSKYLADKCGREYVYSTSVSTGDGYDN